jgi:hypothetical protein
VEQPPSARAQEMREQVQANPAAMAFKERFAQSGNAPAGLGASACMGCGGGRGCCVSVETPTSIKTDSPVPKFEAEAAYNAMRKMRPEKEEYEDEIDPKTGKKTGKKKKKKKQLVLGQ